MKKRLDYIDRAKGILIILMVIGHVWQSGFLFDVIYAFHMPAFFVISGILMEHTKSYQKPWGKFVRSRFFAYGIPFLFIEVLGVATDIIRNGVTLNWKGYLYNTLTFNFNDPNLWFIVNLCLIEVLMAALMKIKCSRKMICGTAVALFVLRFVLPAEMVYVPTISSACKYFVCFTVGFVGSKLLQKDNVFALGASAAVVIGYALLGNRITLRAVKDLAYLISGLAGAYLVLRVSDKVWPSVLDRVLSAAGRNTLTIYGTHHIYYATLGVLLSVKDFATTPVSTGVLILLAVVLLEVPTIYVINRWLPFLAGKRKKL